MEQPGYGEYITSTIRSLPYEIVFRLMILPVIWQRNFPYYMIRSKLATNVKLKRMADKGEIRRLKKGLYCHVKQSVFGKVIPNIDEMMIKTLTSRNGAKIGYETGATLLNRLGLTTLIPRKIEIATNNFDAKLLEGCHIKLKKPVTTVTDEISKRINKKEFVEEIL